MAEIIDVINENDVVIGQVARDELYRKKLSHRIVHVLVFDKNNQILLAKSCATKPFGANMWGTSTGGHVRAGETTEQAARRELGEELGIQTNLTLIGKDWFETALEQRKCVTVFKAIYEGPFFPSKDEVERINFMSLNEAKDLKNRGENVTAELLWVLHHFF